MRRTSNFAPDGVEVPGQDTSIADATRRINEILNDADRQAGQIIVNAEVEARQYVASVKEKVDLEAVEYGRAMAALSATLISQAEVLSRESERLLAGATDYDPVGSEILATEEPAPPRKTEEIAPPRDHEDVEDKDSEEFSAGARLLATQMAVAGSRRSDIHDRLANDFGIADPAPLLDSILGPA